MNVLILGSGGREHALAWKIAQSPLCGQLFIGPGNPGTASVGTNLEVDPLNFEQVAALVLAHDIAMLVVGPEAPLVEGIADYFATDEELKKVAVIGPGKEGARLEGSKDFAKEFMNKYRIPTAGHRTFTPATLGEAKAWLAARKPPYVLKADGLAGGKGVVIASTLEEATAEIDAMLGSLKFGAASERVVIEDFLEGIELSVFVVTDGKDYVMLPSAKDYKRIGEGDTGLNTGGMGAVSPPPFADEGFMERVEAEIVKPTIDGLQREGIPYKGFIFFGLIKTSDGPKVIEYNVRMGDPETEVVMPRIKSDFLNILLQTSRGELGQAEIDLESHHAATVMLVAEGYPGKYDKGYELSLPDAIDPEVTVFHAGTRLDGDKLVSSGGRIIAVTGKGNSLREALKKAYLVAEEIHYEGKYFRRDIGKDVAPD